MGGKEKSARAPAANDPHRHHRGIVRHYIGYLANDRIPVQGVILQSLAQTCTNQLLAALYFSDDPIQQRCGLDAERLSDLNEFNHIEPSL